MLPSNVLHHGINGNDIKGKIFNDYDDHKRIDELYQQIEKRDQDLLNNPTNSEIVKEHSRKTLLLASNALKCIKWTKYYPSKRKVFNALDCIAIFLGSVVIFFGYDVIGKSLVTSLPVQIEFTSYVGFIIIIRTLVSFSIAKIIMSYKLSSMEIDRNNNVYLITLPKHGEVRLFMFSLIIVGIPLVELLVGGVLLDSYFLDLLGNEIGYKIGLIYFMIEVGRMAVLIFLIRKLVVRNSLNENLEVDVLRSPIQCAC